MLHAVNRRKARLDAFRAAGSRVPLEDVVTSTLFGPLLFFEAEQMEAVIDRMLRELDVPRPAWEGPLQLSLWPRQKTHATVRTNYVEPDAVIADAAGTSLLLEIKWGAPLGDRELAAQWLSLAPEARPRSQHLIIVLESSPYDAAVAADRAFLARQPAGTWQGCVRPWRRVADAFQVIGIDTYFPAGLRRWAQAAHAFIKREDPRSLIGWQALDVPPVDTLAWRFATPWFDRNPPTGDGHWRYREDWFALPATGSMNWEFAA